MINTKKSMPDQPEHTATQTKLEQKINEFRQVFSQELSQRLIQLEGLWRIAQHTQVVANFKAFRFEVHSLKGSSAALNYIKLSELLGQIEQHVANCETHELDLSVMTPLIDLLIKKLMALSEQVPNPLLTVHQAITASSSPVSLTEINDETVNTNLKSHREISIAIVDEDNAVGSFLTKLLSTFGFVITHYSSVQQLKKGLESTSYRLVLLDLATPETDNTEVFNLAKTLTQYDTDVFILSSHDSFDARLFSVRAEVNDFLLKPVNITSLVSKIRKNFKIDLIRPYKILLLDDQAAVGVFYKTLLESQGIDVLVLTQANQIMTSLESFHPDIFLLDMHMPEINGFEVAKLIRQQAKYDYVPVIFLTADNDIMSKIAALEAGADDVIPKDTSPELILRQLDSRIQRSQQIRFAASRDSLTGVLNHGQIMEAASHAMRMASRHIKPIVVVMIDLDNFKKVNDTYGHIGGDKVLVSLGQLIQQSIRETDYVGRYGGEEFLVVFSDADSATIERKMNNILTAFQAINFTVNEFDFTCSFSAGLASSENYDKLSELIGAADAALYQAKGAGKKQIWVDSN
ncbi:diguanylate cyclase [Flavobacterium sp. W21_SRS_FM6]